MNFADGGFYLFSTEKLYLVFLVKMIVDQLQQKQEQVEIGSHIYRKIVFEIGGRCQYKYNKPVCNQPAGYKEGKPAFPAQRENA